MDITEVKGADSLYEANGIILESENNATRLFGSSHTFYSAEGSSLSIRAMIYLSMRHALSCGKTPRILAGRNAHKAFITAAALLDVSVEWFGGGSLLCCDIDPEKLEQRLATGEITALYVTSPDYLGNLCDIAALSRLCKKYHTLLLVDNAHGAYLHFLSESLHPIALGADAASDSAHKTLPVLTGGGYLHIGKSAPDLFWKEARAALSLFGSTSPSYLILQSLDAANAYLADGYKQKLLTFSEKVWALKKRLRQKGFMLCGSEPLKITIAPKAYGYTGYELSEILRDKGIECEFADADYLTLMLTPENGEDIAVLEAALCQIAPKAPILCFPPRRGEGRQKMSPRAALFGKKERVSVEACVGRIYADLSVSCPPAVPIVLCGEEITEDAVAALQYYGITTCEVVAE